MKTSHEIRCEIDRITALYKKDRRPLSAKDEKHVRWLRSMALYLDTEPTEKELDAQLKEVCRQISFLQERFKTFSPPPRKSETTRQRKAMFDKLYEIPKLCSQKRALNYILSDNLTKQ